MLTCQHTCCSEAYCLRTRNGKQECWFGYPKDLQPSTTIIMTEDMLYIVSRHKVVQYWTKYITKSEPRSQSLKDTFANITRTLKEDDWTVKAVQKILINTVGEAQLERGTIKHRKPVTYCYNSPCTRLQVVSLHSVWMAQELSKPMYKREREQQLILVRSLTSCPSTPFFNFITLLDFTRQYTMPKELVAEPNRRSKGVIVITQPYCSPDLSGHNYEQYCHQSLMQHKAFRDINKLKAGHDSFTDAYADFLQSGNRIYSDYSSIINQQKLRRWRGMSMQFLINLNFCIKQNYYLDPLFIELKTRRTAKSANNQITEKSGCSYVSIPVSSI